MIAHGATTPCEGIGGGCGTRPRTRHTDVLVAEGWTTHCQSHEDTRSSRPFTLGGLCSSVKSHPPHQAISDHFRPMHSKRAPQHPSPRAQLVSTSGHQARAHYCAPPGDAHTPNSRLGCLRGVTDTETSMLPVNPEAQCAFKDLMTHGVLQFALRIAFRCVLHRCNSQDIHCL